MNRTLLALALALTLGSRLAAQTPAVATQPSLAPAPRLVVPVVQKTRLANGLSIEVVPMHEVPLVQATLLVSGGARLDGSRPGLATFTANMLDEGAGTRDAFALAAEVAYLGASLNTGAGWDAVTVDVGAPKRTFSRAMGLMADVVLRPTFSVADVKRQRDLRLASILQQRDQPGAVAGLVFNAMVFPGGHPYHAPINGDSAATAGLDSASVREFWRRAADPRRATLVVTGDVTVAEVRALAQKLFGGWRAPARPFAPPPAGTAPGRPATHIVLVDKPGAAQSVIAIGAPGVTRRSPDYPAITLMNTILGGSFSSRLNDVLREQKGYTYGAGSGYSWRPLPGPFTASAQVRSNVTDSSLAIFFREFRRIRDSGVTGKELERARAYLVLGSLGDFETTGQVAGQLAALTVLGLPLTTIPADLAAIQHLTAADVQRAARTYLDPDHLTIVVVGDIATIRPGIEALGLGPVEVRDYNGNEVGK
ncbi:MAG: M16 family metallopeptidase [Bacillota bacterium]|jgi:zinc protease